MIVKLRELKSMAEALDAVLVEKLPVKTSWWLARALKDIASEFETMEKARQGLINKHAKKDEDGNMVIKNDQYVMEDTDAFQAEFAELAAQEVEIKYNPISIEQFGDINIKGVDILKLGRLIKDEEEVEPVAKVLEIPE